MNVLHLLWIVPMSACIGFAVCALFVASREDGSDG